MKIRNLHGPCCLQMTWCCVEEAGRYALRGKEIEVSQSRMRETRQEHPKVEGVHSVEN